MLRWLIPVLFVQSAFAAETTASIQGQTVTVSCWSNKADEVMVEAVVALLDGNVQRRYRTLKMERAKSGTQTVEFGKATTAYIVTGFRLSCSFRFPGLTNPVVHATSLPLNTPINVVVGQVAKAVVVTSGEVASGTRRVSVVVPIK